jgi:hypothetical protein
VLYKDVELMTETHQSSRWTAACTQSGHEMTWD